MKRLYLSLYNSFQKLNDYGIIFELWPYLTIKDICQLLILNKTIRMIALYNNKLDEEKEDGTKLETYFVEKKYQYFKRMFPLDYSKKNKRIMDNLKKANKKKKEPKKTNYENFYKNK